MLNQSQTNDAHLNAPRGTFWKHVLQTVLRTRELRLPRQVTPGSEREAVKSVRNRPRRFRGRRAKPD